MTKLNPSMRLKVKGDTFFLPDSNGGVYFRNNSGSFRMEGRGIDQWVAKLIPVLDGKYSLDDLTDGLPDEYRNRVVEIVNMLYQNGFVQIVADRSHQLPDPILQKYASQIEFLNSFGGSGAYRFQSYRQTKVLAVGSGSWLVSMAAALFESGLSRFHVLITDSHPTHRQRLAELTAHARTTDPEAALEEMTLPKAGLNSWREAVKMFDAILYVSQEGELEELRVLHAACREEKKVFLPVICLQGAGLAGPLVHPDSEACWESAWRRIHRSVLKEDLKLHTVSSTAGAMLTNVIVFEWFKMAAGAVEQGRNHKFYLLDLETLEGSWHSFMPHPLVTGRAEVQRIRDLELLQKESSDEGDLTEWLTYFDLLTSAESGVFHLWQEGELKQLPLAQCRVQAADPLSEGPAELLPERICTGLTHEEARREAGLAGIEAYVSRMVGLLASEPSSDREAKGNGINPQECVGVGAGTTASEGICRALHHCLSEELNRRQGVQQPLLHRVELTAVEDQRCQYDLQALTTMQGSPVIGLGEDIAGFPVVWVGTSGCWYGSVGLNVTLALRKALQQALLKAQNPMANMTAQELVASSVIWEEALPQSLAIPAFEDTAQRELLQTTLRVLNRSRKQPVVFDLAVEPFMREKLAGVFCVSLREEESR
ncbi:MULTISPECIES: putative thiazole-containing bacteriocin maturation protein [unclassified Paenibacillus]|uniref:putative thiazole-containing bacteriocin maturation protein n=1 Tax=unclassified Paenibacillus TaxID=185978 RepID=UPI001AE1382F|nr:MULTISPECIES: putative thiazole-containing bacteriocin maturation protein [unclassified Paenibacillus]MBP1157423.1 putative thiazole-containing bacteriocin maturation protein [Paenibacillus sp. PvP091]MBP1171839.1 putative thiazole-containing bacteriocin maturation protein [Paenibacillus sp. PvR098]MBP2438220.1 putative thiazole-containing bacteriocin maturation protein [Paenibacillus sp. PvP052]